VDSTRLGRTGLQVSRICLGTMTFGLQCDETTSRAILDAAVQGGVTFIDTADVYPLGGGLDTVGRTEEIIGRWLADTGRRDELVLATKCVGATGPLPWERGASRRHVLDAIDASLRRLQTDFIDLYQLHSFDAETPIDETLSALDHLVQVGKVRYIGCSNFLAYQLARAVGRSEALGLVRMDSVQPRYNLLFRQIERELLPLCAEEGIGVSAGGRAPLRRGARQPARGRARHRLPGTGKSWNWLGRAAPSTPRPGTVSQRRSLNGLPRRGSWHQTRY
jgi:1-deoxyxylulose-5-phosphate synthase